MFDECAHAPSSGTITTTTAENEDGVLGSEMLDKRRSEGNAIVSIILPVQIEPPTGGPIRRVLAVYITVHSHRERPSRFANVHGLTVADEDIQDIRLPCETMQFAPNPIAIWSDPYTPRNTLNSRNSLAGSGTCSRQTIVIGRSPSALSSTTGPQAR